MSAPMAMMAAAKMNGVVRSLSTLRFSVASRVGDNGLLSIQPGWACSNVRQCTNVKMSKQLRKMLDRGPKKKWYTSPMGIHPSAPAGRKRVYSDGQVKRADHISRVLYQYIAQIINSGEVSPFLAEKAVEIVRVRVLPDFSAANVYWLASGSAEDQDIEAELKRSEGKIRQVLTSLHLLGRVPFLTFVKDEKLANHQKVMELLKTADLGPEEVGESSSATDLHLEDMGYPSPWERDRHSRENLADLDVSSSHSDLDCRKQAVSSNPGGEGRSSSQSGNLDNDGTSSSLNQNASEALCGSTSPTRLQDLESSGRADSGSTSLNNSQASSDLCQKSEAPDLQASPLQAAKVELSSQSDLHRQGRKAASAPDIELRSDIYGVPRARILEKLQTMRQKRPPEAASESSAAQPAGKSPPLRPWKKQQQLSIGRQDYTLRDFWREGHVRPQPQERLESEADGEDEEDWPRKQ